MQWRKAFTLRPVQRNFFSPNVDAVLIATATPTHADYIEMAVAAGKAALCEKPIDLSLARVSACAAKIKGTKVPIQLGFNRRYDPGHSAARVPPSRRVKSATCIRLLSHHVTPPCHHVLISRQRAACSAT